MFDWGSYPHTHLVFIPSFVYACMYACMYLCMHAVSMYACMYGLHSIKFLKRLKQILIEMFVTFQVVRLSADLNWNWFAAFSGNLVDFFRHFDVSSPASQHNLMSLCWGFRCIIFYIEWTTIFEQYCKPPPHFKTNWLDEFTKTPQFFPYFLS
jgi:hypothetical protein